MYAKRKRASTARNLDLWVQIHLAEYKVIQARIQALERIQHQVLVLGLGAISVVIPIFLGELVQLPASVIVALLYALAIVFSALTTHYIIVNFDFAECTMYVHDYLAPELNRITGMHSEHRGLDFEHRQRLSRRRPLVLQPQLW